jgi:hypothetical protein
VDLYIWLRHGFMAAVRYHIVLVLIGLAVAALGIPAVLLESWWLRRKTTRRVE